MKTIKEARAKAHVTQAELAACLHVSKRAVEEWEAGTRKPKMGTETLIEKISVLGSLTKDGREALAAGEVSWEEMELAHKIDVAGRISKWGKYPSTFSANLEMVPEAVLAKLTGEELGMLIDAIKAAYEQGRKDGGRDE